MSADVNVEQLINQAYETAVAEEQQKMRPAGAAAIPIPDPRILCPIYREHKDAVCNYLKSKLGNRIGSLVCAALALLCA